MQLIRTQPLLLTPSCACCLWGCNTCQMRRFDMAIALEHQSQRLVIATLGLDLQDARHGLAEGDALTLQQVFDSLCQPHWAVLCLYHMAIHSMSSALA